MFKFKKLLFKMVNITKKELEIDNELKNRIGFICGFCNTTPTIINVNIRKINKTNLNYIEPHRIIVKGIIFPAFNYSNEIFSENLSNRIKLSELEDYIKQVEVLTFKIKIEMMIFER